MLDKTKLDAITNAIFEKLPMGLKAVKGDAEDALKAGISQAISKLDLVTKEELESQAKVLKHLKQRIGDLEKHIDGLK